MPASLFKQSPMESSQHAVHIEVEYDNYRNIILQDLQNPHKLHDFHNSDPHMTYMKCMTLNMSYTTCRSLVPT